MPATAPHLPSTSTPSGRTAIGHVASGRAGFTLLELIISVALVLLLMLAITKIFSITSTTIGASQGLSAGVRDARAAQTVFNHDIGSMAADSPFVWIRSDQPFTAFRNAADQARDHDTDPLTVDLDGNGREGETTVSGENLSLISINTRVHRLDRFSFCARDRFARQTGNGPNTVAGVPSDILVSSQSSAEAWIYYGPLVLPRNDGSFFRAGSTIDKCEPGSRNIDPGLVVGAPAFIDRYDASKNPNNFYASQWTIGRVASLMVQPGGTVANPTIKDADGNQEYYNATNQGATSATVPYALFSSDALARKADGAVVTASAMRGARYDLVGTDIATAKTTLKNYINAAPALPWPAAMASDLFQVNPFVLKPINAAAAAGQAPIFLSGASQFIIEFAGDFMEQDNNGAITDVNANGTPYEPDGQIDFVIVGGERKIRWYGYPRNTSGTDAIRVNEGDVLPVSDVATSAVQLTPMPVPPPPVFTAFAPNTVYSNPLNPYASFEHFADKTGTDTGFKSPALITTPSPSSPGYTSAAAPAYATYYAAFGPDTVSDPKRPRPKLYRMLLTLDRPEMAGRTEEGQTFEYVFNAP